MRRKIIALAGSITENGFWTDSNWVSGDVNIESGYIVKAKAGSVTTVLANKKIVVKPGATFIAEAGSQFKFGSGASIDVQGTLTVQGTSASSGQVTFTRSGISGTWNGITVTGSATMEYASLSHCETGVLVSTYKPFTMEACTVKSSVIGAEFIAPVPAEEYMYTKNVNNCLFSLVLTGVAVTEFSSLVLSGNTITPAILEGGTGVLCIAASPKLLGNTIAQFKEGLYCTEVSSPVLEDGIAGGYNHVHSNETAVVCEDGSDAVLGLYTGAMGDEGGQNSIAGSSSGYDVVLINGCDVEAENNWWGTEEDPGHQFNVDGSSTLDYDPWLTADPLGSNPMVGGGGKLTETEKSGSNGGAALNPGAELMREALEKRTMGQYAQAATMLKSMVTNSELPFAARRWAVGQLLAVSQWTGRVNLSSYLRTTLIAHPALARQIKAVLPVAYLSEGATSQAIAAFEENIAQYPNSGLECAALYGKFVHALRREGDRPAAQELLARLETGYPESIEARIAGVQFESGVGNLPGLPGPGNVSSVGQSLTPVRFALQQNYPNPFNPTTTIEYSIPADGIVSLEVYDILGQHLLALETGFKTAGTHVAVFDASRFSSGVYFYKLVAGSGTLTRRMLLLK